jgi:hypothetical protein
MLGKDFKDNAITLHFIKSDNHVYDITLKVDTTIISGYCYNYTGNLMLLKLSSTLFVNVDCNFIIKIIDMNNISVKPVGTGLFSNIDEYRLTRK